MSEHETHDEPDSPERRGDAGHGIGDADAWIEWLDRSVEDPAAEPPGGDAQAAAEYRETVRHLAAAGRDDRPPVQFAESVVGAWQAERAAGTEGSGRVAALDARRVRGDSWWRGGAFLAAGLVAALSAWAWQRPWSSAPESRDVAIERPPMSERREVVGERPPRAESAPVGSAVPETHEKGARADHGGVSRNAAKRVKATGNADGVKAIRGGARPSPDARVAPPGAERARPSAKIGDVPASVDLEEVASSDSPPEARLRGQPGSIGIGGSGGRRAVGAGEQSIVRRGGKAEDSEVVDTLRELRSDPSRRLVRGLDALLNAGREAGTGADRDGFVVRRARAGGDRPRVVIDRRALARLANVSRASAGRVPVAESRSTGPDGGRAVAPGLVGVPRTTGVPGPTEGPSSAGVPKAGVPGPTGGVGGLASPRPKRGATKLGTTARSSDKPSSKRVAEPGTRVAPPSADPRAVGQSTGGRDRPPVGEPSSESATASRLGGKRSPVQERLLDLGEAERERQSSPRPKQGSGGGGGAIASDDRAAAPVLGGIGAGSQPGLVGFVEARGPVESLGLAVTSVPPGLRARIEVPGERIVIRGRPAVMLTWVGRLRSALGEGGLVFEPPSSPPVVGGAGREGASGEVELTIQLGPEKPASTERPGAPASPREAPRGSSPNKR